MPNAAPPLPPLARRRTADAQSSSAARPAMPRGVAAAPALAPEDSPTQSGVPASWAGFGGLLAGGGERTPAEALRLATVAAGDGAGGQTVDLSGMWALPAEQAASRSHEVIHALDGKGRLMLPVTISTAARVPAERDGALVTVFLPGSTERPRPGFSVAALPLDARGRLTLTTGVRREAGIPDGADVLAVLDPDRGTVTVTAASRLSDGITSLLDRLRRPTTVAAALTEEPAGTVDAALSPAALADDGCAGRLRVVR